MTPVGACKAGGWACSICCWADESESLSLSWGLGMLGDVLRLSWSMSLGSLLPSSLTLRLSELSPSPSDGELGRLISCVFVFLELVLSASSVSEVTFSRWRLVLLRGEEASSFTFCRGKPTRSNQAKGGHPISLSREMMTVYRQLCSLILSSISRSKKL